MAHNILPAKQRDISVHTVVKTRVTSMLTSVRILYWYTLYDLHGATQLLLYFAVNFPWLRKIPHVM